MGNVNKGTFYSLVIIQRVFFIYHETPQISAILIKNILVRERACNDVCVCRHVFLPTQVSSQSQREGGEWEKCGGGIAVLGHSRAGKVPLPPPVILPQCRCSHPHVRCLKKVSFILIYFPQFDYYLILNLIFQCSESFLHCIHQIFYSMFEEKMQTENSRKVCS